MTPKNILINEQKYLPSNNNKKNLLKQNTYINN